MTGGLKSLKKRRRIQVISIAGVSLALVLILLWFLPDDSFQFLSDIVTHCRSTECHRA